MTRLVAVSNRVTVPKQRSMPAGGLAVGVLAAMKTRGGLRFGWSGAVTDDEPAPAKLTERQDVTFATIDLPRGLRTVLRRLLQRCIVADVPLLLRRGAVCRDAPRGLPAREPPVR